MIADADPIGANCLDYIVNVDVRLSLSILKRLRPNTRGEPRPEAGAERTLLGVGSTALFGAGCPKRHRLSILLGAAS
jgi:hypothetical protein